MSDITESAKEYIKELFGNRADGHDIEHSLRVYGNAMLIAETEEGCSKEIVALASLLHDVDDHKLFNNEHNENARRFLRDNGIGDEETEYVCRVINSVSFSKNRGNHPDTLEGRIVQDADRLDAMGAIGVARTFAYGGANGRGLDSSIEHFYDKLLLLKDEINTESAKRIAEKRHRFLEDFLKEYKEETE